MKDWWLTTWSMAQHLKWDGKIVMNVLWGHGRRQSQHVHGYRPSTCMKREERHGLSHILLCPVFIQYLAVGCVRIIWYLAGAEIFFLTTITSQPTCLLSSEHQQYQHIFLLGVSSNRPFIHTSAKSLVRNMDFERSYQSQPLVVKGGFFHNL